MITVKKYGDVTIVHKKQGNLEFTTSSKGDDEYVEIMCKALENYNLKDPYDLLFKEIEKIKKSELL